MNNKSKVPVKPKDPKINEIDPAVENFNDGDDTQAINTANDAFDEADNSTVEKVPVKEPVLPPGSTDMLDDGGAQPVLNQDDESL